MAGSIGRYGLLWWVICASIPAQGQPPTTMPPTSDNPADVESARLAGQAQREGRRPEGVLPLLQLVRRWDRTTPQKTQVLLSELATRPQLSPARRVHVRALLAEASTRLGDVDEAIATYAELGYLSSFRVIGGFDNEGKLGLDAETPVEKARMQAPDLQTSYEGKERPVAWRELPTEIVRDGYVSFDALLRPVENVCALAETFVHSPKARPLALWFGAGGASKLYWNGDEVFRDKRYRQPSLDRHAVGVRARAGWNRLLVKVCVTDQGWGFHLRVAEPGGGVAKGLKVATVTTDALDIEAERGAPPRVQSAPLAALERAAEGKRPSAAALERLARYLSMTGSDDASERRAKQLAARAVEQAPTLERHLLAANLSEERGEVMRFSQLALQRYPKEPRALLLAAKLRSTGMVPEEALPLLDRIPPTDAVFPQAELLRAQVLLGMDLPDTALALVERLRERFGETPAILRELAQMRHANGDPDGAIEMRRRLLAVRYDHRGVRRVLAHDALQRGDNARLLEHIEAFYKLYPGSLRNLRQIARLYDGIKRDDMALSMYRRATELVPDSASIRVAYARFLLHAGRDALAADVLRRALQLKPQYAQARELLEQLKPAPREDEAYATPSPEILERRHAGRGYPKTILHDLNVSTVFDNGLGSRYTQWAMQVHDDAAARNNRTHSIQFDPDSQRVDVRLARVYRADGSVLESIRTFEQQLGEPWYRIYYDTRALVIVFPDLEPGDVVELRYRVDDIAHRNLFADYYGSMHVFQRYVPTLHRELVLITPTARKFYMNQPKLGGLEHTQKVEPARRIDRWVARDVPAIQAEDGMPGITEVSPYLHVSTYRNWEDVGRWYWGLIQDQLYADAALRDKVAELVADAKTVKEKVARIHNWVVGNTRYVGLEFGIHGFLPYRVPLIVQRGFGDCKDKASLLYTMLREANVDARIALVRTRRNGQISDLPASLAVFDHAIAYVPELDLFLDGTAEHSGTTELPVQDQGVTVLVVGPEGAQLRTTPVSKPEDNRRQRTLDVALTADGSARVHARDQVTGVEAAGYRAYYQAEGTRAERFERSLGSLYPGVELTSQQFHGLSNLELPVRYEYSFQVPQLGRWDGDRLRLMPSTLSDLVRRMARTPSRRHPLDLEGLSAYREERVLSIPKGMSAVDLPPGGEARSSFGKLRLSFEQQGSDVRAVTEFSLDRDKVAPAEYPAFRRWVEQADQLLRQRIFLRKGER
ncbi:MAG: DUF3857 domain-containing protein [Myxococcales bacterium]|nr:DUF3857 domain-containing protein [Myxococcales bacterium]